MENIIEFKNVNFSYKDKQIFKDFNLNIKRGSFTSIIGPNGSGKSTLMKLIVGLYKAEGEIIIDNVLMSQETYKEIRGRIGIVFENPDNQFVAETVMDELAFALENMNYDKKEIKERVKEIGKLLDIESLMEKEPHSLSGGQKELVSLASALVLKPKILILDEAMDMIDNNRRADVLNVLTNLNNLGLTVINITHNSEELLFGDSIIVMNGGEIKDQGTTKELLRKERLLVGEINSLQERINNVEIIQIQNFEEDIINIDDYVNINLLFSDYDQEEMVIPDGADDSDGALFVPGGCMGEEPSCPPEP